MTGPAILLFRGRGIISALIRWQTRGKYSHAALLLPSGEILEAWQGKGVRVTTLKDWEGVDAFAVPSMYPDQWAMAIEKGLYEIGAGYDYWGVFSFIRKQPSPDNWFCSVLVFSLIAAVGVRLLERIEPRHVYPTLISYSPLLQPIEITP